MFRVPLEIEISVTDEDVLQGCVGDSERCPIARAALRAVRPWLPEVMTISVGGSTLLAWHPELDYLGYLAPAFVDSWVTTYDSGDEVGPLTFVASLEQPSRFWPDSRVLLIGRELVTA